MIRVRVGWHAILCSCGVAATSAGQPRIVIERLGSIAIDGAEVAAFDKSSREVFVASAKGVMRLKLDALGAPADAREFPLGGLVGTGPFAANYAVTHVAADPAGSGLIAACVVPEDFASVRGIVTFGESSENAFSTSVEVGFNPDCCTFDAEERMLVVANEGQPSVRADGTIVDPPGSISLVPPPHQQGRRSVVLDLPLDTLEASDLRINPASAGPAFDLEPEYVSVLGRRAFVTCQENNAVLEINLDTQELVGARGLPDRILGEQTPAFRPRLDVRALPMPDQIAAFEHDGRTVLVMACEGDTRGDAGAFPLADETTLGDLARANRLAGPLREEVLHADSALADLRVCSFSGDADGDGVIERPIAFGTRSALVMDWNDHRTLLDTGPMFDNQWAQSLHEQDLGVFAKRMNIRGSEPEGVTLWRSPVGVLAFVGLERAGMIICIDPLAASPERAFLGQYISRRDGDIAPEGMVVIPAADWGGPYDVLVAAYEVSGTLVTYRLSVEH